MDRETELMLKRVEELKYELETLKWIGVFERTCIASRRVKLQLELNQIEAYLAASPCLATS